MPSSRHNSIKGYQLNLNSALEVLPGNDAQKIRSFIESLQQAKEQRRVRLCEGARDKLVDKYQHVEALCAVHSLIFQQYLKQQDGGDWTRFNNISTEGQKRLQAIRTVADLWKAELVRHYGFLSRQRKYCDTLCAAAKKVRWEEAVVILNQCIYQRAQPSKDGRTPKVKNHINPIEQCDLAKLRSGEYPKVIVSNLEGFGLDKYGLLVRKKWAMENTTDRAIVANSGRAAHRSTQPSVLSQDTQPSPAQPDQDTPLSPSSTPPPASSQGTQPSPPSQTGTRHCPHHHRQLLSPRLRSSYQKSTMLSTLPPQP
ncbi:hypothetical protein F5883DRAFT_40105 [Diaporthe sp. PMI_573]|nr:hypothetical protein F5883DRAFT_40105 [Diaporthaceae sp. PMI_573]